MYTIEQIFINDIVDNALDGVLCDEHILESAMDLIGIHDDFRKATELLIFAKRDVKNEIINILTADWLDIDYYSEASMRLEALQNCYLIARENM